MSKETLRPPNIVLIVADDMGYADLSCYGNDRVHTPHLDRLAAEGVRFTDFHSNGCMCSPTRAALLTGRYQQRGGVEQVGGIIHASEVIISRYLRDSGYACGMFGKWHISGHGRTDEYYREHLPTKHGFDRFVGIMSGFIDPVGHLTSDGRCDWWHGDQLTEEKGYATHLLTKHACEFIREHKRDPFFCYIPYVDIHFPWMTPEDTPYYKSGETYSEVGDPAHSRVGPHDGKSEMQAVVHRMIAETDAGVGQVVAVLEELGLADNTFVFFTSDNGGYVHYRHTNHGQISNMGPYRSQKGSLYEGGHRVPAIAWQPGTVSAGVSVTATALTHDLAPTFLELAGIDPPASDGPNAFDGHSLLPLLTEQRMLPSRHTYWRYTGQRAMRNKAWKLYHRCDCTAELYHLDEDPGETRNLAAEHPERVASMLAALAVWEQDVDNSHPD